MRHAIRNILHEAGVYNPEEQEACMKWAFGEDYGVVLLSSLDNRWNNRHSDIFEVRGSDNFINSIERIGKAYLETL